MADDLWEKMPGESTKQYERFCAYRDMGPERSIRKLAQQLKVRRQTLEILSVKFEWVSRVAAYDLDLEKRTRRDNERAIKKMRENHVKLATQITAKAARRLLTISDDALDAADIARLVEVGVKIERLSRGEATENKKVSGEVTANHNHQGEITIHHKDKVDLSQLTDEELESFAGLLKKLRSEPVV